MKLSINMILITFFNILLIFLLIYFLLRRRQNPMNINFMRGTKKFVVIIYSLLLLGAVVGMYLLPTKNLYTISNVKYSTNNKMDGYDVDSFVKMVMESNLDKNYGAYRNGNWTFNTNSKEITLTAPERFIVFVEKDNVKSNNIELVSYTGKAILSNIDFTKDLKPVIVELKGSNLSVNDPKKYNIEKILFHKDFTVNAFLKEHSGRVGDGYTGSGIPDLLYIKIPKNVKIVGNVHFIRQWPKKGR